MVGGDRSRFRRAVPRPARGARRGGLTRIGASRLTTWSWRLASLVVLVVGLQQGWGLYETYLESERLPLWDMAKNGGQAVELADDVRYFRPARFLWHLNEHDKWPFGYSLLLAPFLLLGGSTYAAATLPHALFFALTPLALVAVARRIDDGLPGLWAGFLASGLWLSSPEIRLFGVLIQREIPGALFTLLALMATVDAVKAGSLRSWRLAALSVLGLFFIKYNYGLAWLVTLVLYEWLRSPKADRQSALTFVGRFLQPWRPSDWRIRAIGSVFYLAALLVLSGRSPGTLIYAAIVLATAVFMVSWLRDRSRVGKWLSSLEPRLRAGVELLVLPLWIWCLSPSPIHPRDVFNFLDNRDSGLALGASLLFYPQSLAEDYLAVGTLAVPLLIGAGLVLHLGVRSPEPRLLLLFCAVMSFLALLHPYKAPRFILTLAPALFLAASLGLSSAILGPRQRGPARSIFGSIVLVALLAAPFLRTEAHAATDIRTAYEKHSGDPRLIAVLDDLPGLLGAERRVGFVGTFNDLSPWLLGWATYGGTESRNLQTVPNLPFVSADLESTELQRRLQRWSKPLTAIAALRVEESSRWAQDADYQTHNAWQIGVVRALDEDPGWINTESRSYADLGIELAIFRRADTTRPRPAAAGFDAPSRRE